MALDHKYEEKLVVHCHKSGASESIHFASMPAGFMKRKMSIATRVRATPSSAWKSSRKSVAQFFMCLLVLKGVTEL